MKYVIVGGDAAGMSAAMEIYRHDQQADITTIEKGFHYSYGQCGLPYVIDGRVQRAEDVVHKTAEQFQQKYGIHALTGHCVTKMDFQKQVVYGYNVLTNQPFEKPYDRLLIATGATPKKALDEEAIYALKGIYSFKTIDQVNDIQAHLQHASSVTIVGGGYIALELAETFQKAGKAVRLLVRGKHVASFLEQPFSEKIYEQLVHNGVEVLVEEHILGYEGDDDVTGVRTKKGSYPTDLVIEAVGVEPTTGFLEDQDMYTLRNGAILVNHHMETNIPFVYAAGDCASHFHLLKGKNDYLPLGTTANKQGRVAGLNMAGGSEQFKGIVGTSILKCFDLQIGKTGLSEREALELSIPVKSYTYEAGQHASYYPDVKPLFFKILWHAHTEKVLGIQMIGEDGVDKRIDVFATALHHQLTLRDLIDLDLSYAPPFNSVWDPLQQAAKRQF